MNPNKIKQLAEKMGWTHWEVPENEPATFPAYWIEGGELCIDRGPACEDGYSPWNPETSNADMVDLLEKLLKDGFQITLSAGSGYFSINSLTNEATLRAAVVAFACRCWGIEE